MISFNSAHLTPNPNCRDLVLGRIVIFDEKLFIVLRKSNDVILPS